MMNKLIALYVLVAPALAFAQEHGEAHGGGHEAAGLPTAVYYQAINFVLYAGLLFFFLRKPVKNYFSNRQADFKQALIKAEAARKEAETKKKEIQERLARLQNSSQDSIAQARAEAEALKAKILQDAAELSQKLREDARRTAELEIERAKHELREELLNQSVALAQKMLADKMVEQDQKRLQTEFVDKIQVVR